MPQTAIVNPTCPRCKHYNALLSIGEPGKLKCRDCHHEEVVLRKCVTCEIEFVPEWWGQDVCTVKCTQKYVTKGGATMKLRG
jgi:transposase-like protein